MADDKESEQRRLAERRAYRLTLTGDVSELIDVLKRQSPEAWQSYLKTVEEEGEIEASTYRTILQTAFSIFPGSGAQETTDLLRRMVDMVRDNSRDGGGKAR